MAGLGKHGTDVGSTLVRNGIIQASARKLEVVHWPGRSDERLARIEQLPMTDKRLEVDFRHACKRRLPCPWSNPGRHCRTSPPWCHLHRKRHLPLAMGPSLAIAYSPQSRSIIPVTTRLTVSGSLPTSSSSLYRSRSMISSRIENGSYIG